MHSNDSGQCLTVDEWQALRQRDPAAAAAALRMLGPSATEAFVVELCDAVVTGYPELDDEHLLYAGVELSNASRPVVAEAALRWLETVPSPARFMLVCMLLRGLWFSADTAECTGDRVRRLLAVHDRVRSGMREEYYFACALLNAKGSGCPLDPEVAGRLRSAFLRATGRLPGPLGDDLRSSFADG